MEKLKQQMLERLQKHIQHIQTVVLENLEAVKVSANKSLKEISRLRSDEQAVEVNIKGFAMQRVEELEHLHKSPYFVKCEVVESGTDKVREYFFAKHQLSEESIYSWVAPVAAIRFENPGRVTYSLPSGEKKEVKLLSREQYMIVDGKVIFFAREDEGKLRELIYQEHFTTQKSEFILPEIVAQMEKAQDQVIRAHHYGPLAISGPAGSGKTTLALHRIAYLTQAPDTAPLYPTEKIIVFVQDNGTKEYFSHLLPGLGIHNVVITTFSEWAMDVLGLNSYEYVSRYGENEEEKDLYEYQKIQALRSGDDLPGYNKNPFTVLSKLFNGTKLYEKQRKENKLDRFDLTLLLKSYIHKHGKIQKERTFVRDMNGVFRKRIQKTSIQYSLIVVDEFQNYLPEQLEIFKSCLSEETKAVIYVGDAAQQVYLGTIKKWEDMREYIEPERNIRLDKVYRNTRSILAFIQSLGYTISIPQGVKEGPAVIEKKCETIEEEIGHIEDLLGKYKEGSIGVLAKSANYLDKFRRAFKDRKNVHVLTMNESQGVEFDLVCIVGIEEGVFAVTAHEGVPLEHLNERKSMQKDLLYVALTRAITELHVLGKKTLKDVV